MEKDRKEKAKQYEKTKLIVSLSEEIAGFILLFLFIYLGFSLKLQIYLSKLTSNDYVLVLLFIGVLSAVSLVLSAPFSIFKYKLEHKYGLSNQSFSKFILENVKGILIGALVALPVGIAFYFMLRNYELWWLWTGCIVSVYSILLAKIAPVFIFPLFYKFKPLENERLKQKIIEFCNKENFQVKGVYTFDLSKNTKKANAAFTGLGKSKRIILSDTLLNGFSEDEIITVFAHELGHYKRKHIVKNILLSLLVIFISLFIISVLYDKFLYKEGFSHRWEPGALPLLLLIGGLLSILTGPIMNWVSRKFEYEADRYAVETTKNISSFRTMMEKLAFVNLADENPNKLREFLFYSHPSIKNRIHAVEMTAENLEGLGV